MRFLTLTLALIASAFTFSAFAAPTTIALKIHPQLQKLTPDPRLRGAVKAEPAEGSREELVTLELISDCQRYSGAEHCAGYWNKALTMEGQTFAFSVSVFAEIGSARRTIVMNVCTSGEDNVKACPRWMANQVNFEGDQVPELQLYDSGHWNGLAGDPAAYQPLLKIGPASTGAQPQLRPAP